MVHQIYPSLPYVITNYIFFLAKILYIQSIWRKNRPRKICYFKSTQISNIQLYPTPGDRVLLIWRLSPVTKIPYRKAYGTIDKIGQDIPTNYVYRIRLISSSVNPKRVYYYDNSSCIWSPDTIIVLEAWKTEIFHICHITNNLYI